MTIPLTTSLPTQLQPPTRTCWSISGSAEPPREANTARGPYLALLPVGLAMPPLLPAARWALTPPFHPYPGSNPGRSIFCGAFRRVTPPGRYPAPFLIGVRTFLPAGCPPKRPSSLPRMVRLTRNGAQGSMGQLAKDKGHACSKRKVGGLQRAAAPWSVAQTHAVQECLEIRGRSKSGLSRHV